jgi:hypothetical protein
MLALTAFFNFVVAIFQLLPAVVFMHSIWTVDE